MVSGMGRWLNEAQDLCRFCLNLSDRIIADWRLGVPPVSNCPRQWNSASVASRGSKQAGQLGGRGQRSSARTKGEGRGGGLSGVEGKKLRSKSEEGR